jgi:hypothetical protein
MARVKTNPILLISPHDPTCQSGLIRDAIVLNHLGKTSIAICTAIANQNDIEIDDVTSLSFEEIKRQLDAAGRRYWLDWAVVSGMHELNLVASIIRYLEQTRPGIQILWNPALQHTERSYKQPLNRQEQDLFETLCKKVHTVFLEPGDLMLFTGPYSSEELTNRLSHHCFLYLTGEEHSLDALYSKGTHTLQNHTMTPAHRVTFLSTLSSFLYDGNEMQDACRKSLLFLSNNSTN